MSIEILEDDSGNIFQSRSGSHRVSKEYHLSIPNGTSRELKMEFYIKQGERFTTDHGHLIITQVGGAFGGMAERIFIAHDPNGWSFKLKGGGSEVTASVRAIITY
jgi:hypothetical protein